MSQSLYPDPPMDSESLFKAGMKAVGPMLDELARVTNGDRVLACVVSGYLAGVVASGAPNPREILAFMMDLAREAAKS